MTKFIRCHQCNIQIPIDGCKFAIYKRVIDGEEYVFCCGKCAEQHEKKKRVAGPGHSRKGPLPRRFFKAYQRGGENDP